MKKILVIGGGGREHAIVDAISRSPQKPQIFCAPGNAGIASQATCVPIKDNDVDSLLAFARQEGIDLTVVGPEASLAAGVVDRFREAGLKIFGHTKGATAIESSKEFSKRIMEIYGVPTAPYKAFSDYSDALGYVSGRPFPAVLKYDGLAAGKGVVIAETPSEAEAALKDMLIDARFGKGRVVVEDFLQGPEFSFMCFVDGSRVYPMPLAQDHKRAFDADKGPNTGGMGAYTGLPFITPEDESFALREIVQKTADAMVKEGTPLSGVLYAGLMKTEDGVKVIEFNARFGDPETEVVLPLIKSDIVGLFEAVAEGRPAEEPLWDKNCVSMGVVMASKGYPGTYSQGFPITGIEKCSCVYHMGTALKDDTLVTAGGRVLMVVAKADDIRSASRAAYADVKRIDCDNLFWRNDIAHRALD